MADEARPKLAQIPQGRELTPHSVKVEEDDEERRHRPKPLHLPLPPSNSASSVTLPSFRETYGMTLGGYGAPPPPPPPSGHPSAHGPPPPPLAPPHPSLPPHSAHHDPSRSVPGPRPYPDSPGSTSRPGLPPGVGNGAPPDYGRYHPHDAYRDSKEYYASYPPYHPYPDRQSSYWAPPNYQPAPPESAPRQRTSIACKYCRKRKIRCSGYQNTPDGKCTNCKKTGNDCVFQPVSSTTSTAFVPVSAIQGGVPPGTPLYGAFGQPLGPNGGRGPSGPPTSAGPNGPGGPPGSHPGMTGPPPPPNQPGYGPALPASGGYYHHHPPPPMDHNGPSSHGPPHGPSSHGLPPPSSQQHPPPPPPTGGPSSMMGQRQLPPLSYSHGLPGYPPEDRMARTGKRPRDDEEVDFSNRLPPPPPNYNHISHGSHGSHGSNGYYGASDDSRTYSDSARRSPPSMNGSNHSAVSPVSNGHRGYNTPVPPVLPPPGPMSSVGTDTSVRSSGSTAASAVTSPTERHMSRSPSGDPEGHAKVADSVRYALQPTSGYNGYDYSAREWAPTPGREIDRTMLDRLGTSSASHSEPRGGY